MEIIKNENDKKYEELIRDNLNTDKCPLLVVNDGDTFSLSLTIKDVAKANNFIMYLLSPSYQKDIIETTGIEFHSLNFDQQRLKQLVINDLQSLINSVKCI